MTESRKSKLWWFAGLLVRLVLITIACLVVVTVVWNLLPFLLIPIPYYPHTLFPALVFLGGYTWAIYLGFPFLVSRTKRRRLIISGLIALPLAAVCSRLALVILFVVADPFESRLGAEFMSPTVSSNRVLFFESGFLDRDLSLYAKPKGKKEQFVGSLFFTGEFGLAYAQWTKDGQAVVCSMKGKKVGNTPVMEIVYDFSTDKLISWGDDATIQKIVALHGGMNSQRIDDDMIRANEKTLHFWQIPRR